MRHSSARLAWSAASRQATSITTVLSSWSLARTPLRQRGDLYVYRADGGDTGDGDPIVWSIDYGGSFGKTFGTPALGNLDADPESEIVIKMNDTLFVYEHDGTQKWMTDTLDFGDVTAAPALGNLDADPEPEIVINTATNTVVFEADGTLVWQSPPTGYWHTPPMLGACEWGHDFGHYFGRLGQRKRRHLNDRQRMELQLRRTRPALDTVAHAQASPPCKRRRLKTACSAHTPIADIDSDGQPEILLSHYGWITALNGEDGTILWQTELEPGFPGGVGVADIDGDGQPEIITGMKYEFEPGRFGKLYALNHDGTLLWDVIAEDSTSANNAVVLDLNGDGIFEVAWNGKEQGFTIYNGADGAILFNEPQVFTISGSDYPIIVDVDNDDHAENCRAVAQRPRCLWAG